MQKKKQHKHTMEHHLTCDDGAGSVVEALPVL